MVARSRSVLQEQTVEVMEAVVWRCSPWRSSGGARREVRGGRLEVLAVRSSGGARCSWGEGREPCSPRDAERRTEAEVSLEAEVLEAEVLEAAVAWRALEATNLEGLETAEVLEATAGLEAEANLEVLEAAGAAILEADYLEVLEADCGDHPGGPGGGVHMAAVGLEAAWVVSLSRLKESLGMKITAQGLTTPPPTHLSGEASSWTSSRSRGRTKGPQRSRLETPCGTGSIKLTSPSGDLKGDQMCGSWVSRCRDPTLH
ncbi:unnamed protein product [Arctogadus glacialis]